ncbi:glycosyl-4,4'-diaponeurosporenoate acyltransferase CrtO family protein [Mongoliitalea daihaiensis]|uniref:glycosyl-4,4'-diaponeurosporenoate acyltransferase CrtO family protein n=1 Tax=Mongoliitalea daihaiensis TaxID=2782006 RepID=UPI001F48FDC0|nr:hypothetical protein [Mongoliitalea daihaiensis]UJP64897.1 hypothetical protein IPZ59_19240 [Mongoliitalea daihaiensis]
MIKKLILSLAAIFLVYRSVELLRFLNNMNPDQFHWVGAIAFSFILNLFITGIYAFLGFTFVTSRILPDSYYRIKNSKNIKMIYKLLGVEYFKLLLLKFFWGTKKNRKKYFDGTKTGLMHFDIQTRQSEFGHLIAFITIQIVSIYILSEGHVAIFFSTTFINILGNFYPIILQRNHRIQIERLKLLIDKQAR